jgi:hypothetical protein
VEATSEDPQSPIESAFTGCGPGWRTAEPRTQRVCLVFSLRWSGAHGGADKEIIRQQWNFSPQGSTAEVEGCPPDLESVSVLELAICPDIAGRHGIEVSLAAFRARDQ